MTPSEFAAKWRGVETGERASAQSHFLDLCRVLGQPGPTDADPTGEWYAFEKGAEKFGRPSEPTRTRGSISVQTVFNSHCSSDRAIAKLMRPASVCAATARRRNDPIRA
jgi:hypothetical protein